MSPTGQTLATAVAALSLAGTLGVAVATFDRPAGSADGPLAARGLQPGFTIGTPDQFPQPGVYEDFTDSHGVFIVADHNMIVALANNCTNDPVCPQGTTVRYDDLSGVFRCPNCNSVFNSDGLPVRRVNPDPARTNRQQNDTLTPFADRALERCRIHNAGPRDAPGTPLQVNPHLRYRQDRNQWSKAMSMYLLPKVDAP